MYYILHNIHVTTKMVLPPRAIPDMQPQVLLQYISRPATAHGSLQWTIT